LGSSQGLSSDEKCGNNSDPKNIEIVVARAGAEAGRKQREDRYLTLVLQILVATTFVSEL
jgi:hypothetical protein